MTERIISPGWATYLRVSDEDKQTPERSFAMQRQRIQEQLLVSSEIHFKREYRDTLTGTSPNRKDYQQMLADAEAGSFSHLGLYRADRFGRNTVEGLQAATRLIGLGVKIRVAHMPSLRPEEPDGFFMFLIQMGLAQREVDVMRQRARDGTEVVLRSGGWPNKAPAGYCNKELLIKSGKYERWVEKDPEYCHIIRDAWDLLLTNRYTLDQICEELNERGYVRPSGKPWAWTNQKRNVRYTAKSQLQFIFHNPFYAGWVVSERFGISYGEILGRWESIVTTEEFERGVDILKKHDSQKSRPRRKHYLMRDLLHVKIDDRIYRLYGSTPSGRSQSYSYYITHAKPQGKKLHIPCQVVDSQIPGWLDDICVPQELVPEIREVYLTQLSNVTQDERELKISELNHNLRRLREEETHLGRLVITGKMSEEVYDQLRAEWLEKIRNAETSLNELSQKTNIHLDDLEVALVLMTKLPYLYERLDFKNQTTLLRVLAKRIIVNPQGKIEDYQLNTPFEYLATLVRDLPGYSGGSDHVQYRPPIE